MALLYKGPGHVLANQDRTQTFTPATMVGRTLGSTLHGSHRHGGMGEVYRGRDSKLHRDVAIKVLPLSVASDPDRRARFAREARVLATLNHPNIGAIYGLEEAEGVIALVLELVEGETLAHRLKRGRLPLFQVIAIAAKIADALDAAHEKGIVHRDLKPANIVVQGGTDARSRSICASRCLISASRGWSLEVWTTGRVQSPIRQQATSSGRLHT